MAIELWLEKNDKGRFERVCKGVGLSSYLKYDILTGKLTGNNVGMLSALKKEFVLGKKGRDNDKVYIINNSAYPETVLMTAYRGRGILIMGPDEEDFVRRVLRSYQYGQHVDKRTEKDRHFILYHSVK